MYKTLEELQKNHPVGSIYHTSWYPIGTWCPTEMDFNIFKNEHPNACNFRRKEDGTVIADEKCEKKIEGYLFDGEYWYPAIQTWDGWCSIDEENINV